MDMLIKLRIAKIWSEIHGGITQFVKRLDNIFNLCYSVSYASFIFTTLNALIDRITDENKIIYLYDEVLSAA